MPHVITQCYLPPGRCDIPAVLCCVAVSSVRGECAGVETKVEQQPAKSLVITLPQVVGPRQSEVVIIIIITTAGEYCTELQC